MPDKAKYFFLIFFCLLTYVLVGIIKVQKREMEERERQQVEREIERLKREKENHE